MTEPLSEAEIANIRSNMPEFEARMLRRLIHYPPDRCPNCTVRSLLDGVERLLASLEESRARVEMLKRRERAQRDADRTGKIQGLKGTDGGNYLVDPSDDTMALRYRAESAEAENARLRDALESLNFYDCGACEKNLEIVRAALSTEQPTAPTEEK